MPLVGQLVAQNNEVSVPPGTQSRSLAATYESRRNSDAAPWRSSGYGELAELFFTVAIKSGGKRQETWHAEDEILYLPDGNSRVDVLPMAIFVDRKGTIAAPSCALANTHSWP
jgi:hypothetical protein